MIADRVQLPNGYSRPQKMKRGEKRRLLLEEMKRRDGMTTSEVQRFLCEMNGLNYDERDNYRGARAYRGYWCVALYGNGFRDPGIFKRYCEKGPDKKWRVK